MIRVGTDNGYEERYQRLAPAHSGWRGWSVRGVMGYLRPFLKRVLVDIATKILIEMCKLNQSKNLFDGGVSWGDELSFVLVCGEMDCCYHRHFWLFALYKAVCLEKKSHSLGCKFIYHGLRFSVVTKAN